MHKDYQHYLDAVEELDFIEDTETADAAVKAVLGILASRMKEAQARKLTENLPEPLTYEKLRSHQVRPVDLSVEDYLAEISAEFNLSGDQARTLVDTVLGLAKEDMDKETLKEVESGLPWGWARFVEKV